MYERVLDLLDFADTHIETQLQEDDIAPHEPAHSVDVSSSSSSDVDEHTNKDVEEHIVVDARWRSETLPRVVQYSIV